MQEEIEAEGEEEEQEIDKVSLCLLIMSFV